MNRLAGWLRQLTSSARTLPRHVTNEEILLFLDGEAVGSNRRQMERHLADCWDCRFRCEEIQGTIHHMVECRNLVLDYRLRSAPPSAGALLAARLREQRDLLAVTSHPFSNWLAERRQGALAIAAGVVLTVTVGLLFRPPVRPPVAVRSAGAEETLRQAMLLENAAVVPAGRVRHRSMLLQVRNVTRAFSMAPQRIDVWDDSARQRSALVHTRAEAASAVEKTGTARAPGHGSSSTSAQGSEESQIDQRTVDHLLSGPLPHGFRTLRVNEFSKLVTDPARLSINRDTVHPALFYRPLVAARRQAAQPRILLAELDMRSVDLHPVAEQLTVEDDSSTWEFHLSEELDESVAATEVPAGIFAAPAKALRASVKSESPALTASMDDVVDTLSVLDGAGALTEQDVQLQRTPAGALQVNGVVQDELRRQALLGLLNRAAERGLTVKIDTVAEQHQQTRRSAPAIVEEAAGENGRADSAIEAYFKTTLHLPLAEADRKSVDFENQLLAWASDAESQAEALDEVFSVAPKTQTAAASPQVQREWTAMVEHHASSLHRDLAAIRAALLPLGVAGDSAGCPGAARLRSDASTLVSSTRRITSSLSNFVASTGGASQTAALTPSFACLLQTTEQQSADILTPPPKP